MLVDPGVHQNILIARQQIQNMQHFAALGRVSASMIHEITNPLTAALLYLDQQDQSPGNIKKAKQNIKLLQRYIESARRQITNESTVSSFFIRQQIEQIRGALRPIAKLNNVQIIIERTPNYKIYGDPVKFQQIVSNLIVNAIDAYDEIENTAQPKIVSLRLSNKRQWVIMQVQDHGSGIAPDKFNLIYDDFYSTKLKSTSGMGIGLGSVKRWIEDDFSGSISASSSAENGTVFTVRLRTTPKYTRTG